jgi:hypothetical protein
MIQWLHAVQQRLQRFLFKRLLYDPRDFYIQGHVGVIKRYSEIYPNTKLRGEVYRYYDLGHNLVLNRGRHMSAGLWAGSDGTPPSFPSTQGFNELNGPNFGWVVRGMALGEGTTPEADDDDALETPHVNPNIGVAPGTEYHELDSVTFEPWSTPSPSTSVIFTKTFGINEPLGAGVTADVYEFGLYTAAPDPGGAAGPPETNPPGPPGGPFLVARKTHGLITKSPNFTLQVNWTIEF